MTLMTVPRASQARPLRRLRAFSRCLSCPHPCASTPDQLWYAHNANGLLTADICVVSQDEGSVGKQFQNTEDGAAGAVLSSPLLFMSLQMPSRAGASALCWRRTPFEMLTRSLLKLFACFAASTAQKVADATGVESLDKVR